ncbi:hypothetical protein BCR39DRAFT_52238 [Naematelia encephala]|uniref:BRCT domain-containing protein n=1 Tax=Naematelia encephala TaxID=71784 RepID=A0A1Y2AGK6_9TREE|nr:hypothetical protein BCR39DRAFT_52238 [Naematelia encephala]
MLLHYPLPLSFDSCGEATTTRRIPDTLSCTATVSRVNTLASDSTVRPGHHSASVLSAAEGLRRLRSDWRLPSDLWIDGIPQIFVGFCFQLNRSLYQPGRASALAVVIQGRGGITSDTALPTLENIVVLPSRCIAKAPVLRVESEFTTVDSNWVERCCGSNTLLPFYEPEYVDLGRAEEIDEDLDLEQSNLRPREKLQLKGADRDRFDYIVSLSERYDFDRGTLKDFYNLIKDSAVRDRPKYARGTEGFIRKNKSLFYRAIPAMSARTKSDRMTTARTASSRARLESENTPPSSASLTSSLKHMRSTS